MNSLDDRTIYDTLIVGNGPAGLGVPLQALHKAENTSTNNLSFIKPVLAGLGLKIIGPEATLGRGSIDYQIHSNSAALDFIEDLPVSVRARLANNSDYQALLEAGHNPVPLAIVANVGHQVARSLIAELADRSITSPNKVYQPGTADYLAYDEVFDCLSVGNYEGQIYGNAKNVVLSLGAEPVPLELGLNQEKLVQAEDFLRLEPVDLEALDQKRVVIIGGSHSAFSALHNIRRQAPQAQVEVRHRSSVDLFFPTEEAAKSHGYAYTQAAVDGGKVNRFNGVRGEAQTAFLHVKSGLDPNTRLVQTDELVSESLDQADIIIQATGYQPRRLPIYDPHLNLIMPPEFDDNEAFSPVKIGGCRVFQNGLAQTRRDGVNLFQGEFARKILDQLPPTHWQALLVGKRQSA